MPKTLLYPAGALAVDTQKNMPDDRSTPSGWRASAFAVYKWLVVIPVLGISTLIFGTLVVAFSLSGFPDLASRVFGTWWARLNLAVSMIRVEIENRDVVDPGRSYVVIANHQSLIDIYLLYGCSGLEIKWVMKQELRSVPIIGLACQVMGHIYIDRSNTEAAIASINQGQNRVRNGISIVFFPEGTRSRRDELLPFKKGAFRLAKELQLPILPISIHGTNRVLPSDTMDLRPGTVKLRFHEPIDTSEQPTKDAAELAESTRDLIAQALQHDRA